MARAGRDPSRLSPVLFLNRLALGFLFLLAGIGKVRGGVGEFYKTVFTGMQPWWLPHWFAWPYGHALPFVEILLGVGLVAGLFFRAVTWVTVLALLSFTIALWQKGVLFGGSAGPLHPDLIFITLTFLLMSTGPGLLSADAILEVRAYRRR
jgi:uncharacterized membrane protein YphA (DoxX/SURF4 family)